MDKKKLWASEFDKKKLWASEFDEIKWQEWSPQTEMEWLRTVVCEDDQGKTVINNAALDWFYGGSQKLPAPEGLDGKAVLATIFICSLLDRELPENVKREFCLRFARGFWGRYRSWDEAFGRPPQTRAKAKRHFQN